MSLFTTKCLGLLRLDRSCGNDRLELACDRALKLKAIGYRSLRNILDKYIEAADITEHSDELCRFTRISEGATTMREAPNDD